MPQELEDMGYRPVVVGGILAEEGSQVEVDHTDWADHRLAVVLDHKDIEETEHMAVEVASDCTKAVEAADE